LNAYGSKCSITGEGPEEALEAVHIVPHAESGINELDNGLLMRADLHHLFDDGLLSINSETRNIELDDRLQNTSYWQFNGTELRLRSNGTQISSKYLRQRVK
jgi:predicted restriction endonuclease